MLTIEENNQNLLIKHVSRYSFKRNAHVTMGFKVIERDQTNSGSFGFCQQAHNSKDGDNNEISIVTSKGKIRGRKVYAAHLGESFEQFANRIRNFHQKYKLLKQASRAEPVFYYEEVDGIQVLHATIHTFFADGMDLYEYLEKNKNLSFSEKLNLIIEVIKPAATRFHNQQLAHNDIKPANIIINLLTKMATYIDLDMVQEFSEQRPDLLPGTSGYIPLINEDAAYQDIFALSMVIIEILLNGLPDIENLNTAFSIDFNKNCIKFFEEEFDGTKFSSDDISFAQTLLCEKQQAFFDLSFGIKTADAIRNEVICYFEDEWEQANGVANVEINEAAKRFLSKLIGAYDTKKYPDPKNQHKKHHVSAFTKFALQKLYNLKTNDDFTNSVPNYEVLIDVITQGLLSKPAIAPSAEQLFQSCQETKVVLTEVSSNESLEESKSESDREASEIRKTELESDDDYFSIGKGSSDPKADILSNRSSETDFHSDELHQNVLQENHKRVSNHTVVPCMNSIEEIKKSEELEELEEQLAFVDDSNMKLKESQGVIRSDTAQSALVESSSIKKVPSPDSNMKLKESQGVIRSDTAQSALVESSPIKKAPSPLQKNSLFKPLSKKEMVALQTPGVALAAGAMALGILIALWKAAPVIMATGATVGPAGILAASLGMGLATLVLGGAAIAASCVTAAVADNVIENTANSMRVR